MKLEFSVYRYNPDVDDAPHMQDYTEAEEGRHDAAGCIDAAERKDPSLSFRRPAVKGSAA